MLNGLIFRAVLSWNRVWLLGLLGLLPLHAEQFALQTFAEEQGLHTSTIRMHVQDVGGYHWLGTENGLFRFDGERFEEIGVAQGLTEKDIRWLHASQDGSIWLRGAKGIWQLQNNRAVMRIGGFASLTAELSWQKQDFDLDRAGNIWWIAGNALYRATATETIADYRKLSPVWRYAEPLYSINASRLGEPVYVGCGNGMCAWKQGAGLEGNVQVWGWGAGVPRGPYLLLVPRPNRLLARSASHVLELAGGSENGSGSDARWNDLTENLPPLGKDEWMPAMAETLQRQLLVNCEGGFAQRMDDGRWRVLGHRQVPGLPESVQSIRVDRQGGIWLGSAWRGLLRWNGNGLWRTFQNEEALPLGGLKEVAVDATGNPWALSPSGAMFVGQPEARGDGWRFVPGPRSLPAAATMAMYLPPDAGAVKGNAVEAELWLQPAGMPLLVRYGLQSKRLENVPLPAGVQQATILQPLGSGELLVGTSQGLFHGGQAAKDWSFERIYPLPGAPASAIGGISRVGDNLWLAAGGKLVRIGGGRTAEYPNLPGVAAGFSADMVAVHRRTEADAETVWVADAKRNAVAAFSLQDGSLKNVTPAGFAREIFRPHGMQFDEAGKLWICTGRGLVMWDGQMEWNFTQSTGLPGNHVLQTAMHKGSLRWLATTGGLALHRPFLDSPESSAPGLIFSKLMLGTKVMRPDEEGEAEANQSGFAVHFAVLSSPPAGQVRVRYRIPGLQDEWRETSDRALSFPNFAPGHHQLEMQTMGLNGQWAKASHVLRIFIHPAWYQTAWARGVMALLIFAGIGFLIRTRTKATAQHTTLRLQEVLDAYPYAIFILDKSGQVQLANRVLESLLKQPISAILGQPVKQQASSLFSSQFHQQLSRCYAEEVVCTWEQTFEDGEAEGTELRFTLFPIADCAGLLHSVAGLIEDVTERNKLAKDLQGLSEHRANVLEQERARIAHEIHDELGQQLTAMKIGLRLLRGGEESRVQELVKQADETIQALRRIATELRPAILDHYGLAAAIEWQTREFAKKTELAIACQVPPSLPPVSKQTAITAFRILQEALSNAAQHAQATHIDVLLTCQQGRLSLVIEDDGVGLTEKATRSGRVGFGLLGMQERARSVGGYCTITRKSDGYGSIVLAGLPLAFEMPKNEEVLPPPIPNPTETQNAPRATGASA